MVGMVERAPITADRISLPQRSHISDRTGKYLGWVRLSAGRGDYSGRGLSRIGGEGQSKGAKCPLFEMLLEVAADG